LRPAFKKDGSITAGNASGINDGAAAGIVMSRKKAEELGLTPLATICAIASAAIDPSVMGLGPISATKNALEKDELSVADLHLIEANDAFDSQLLAIGQDLDYNPDIVNVN